MPIKKQLFINIIILLLLEQFNGFAYPLFQFDDVKLPALLKSRLTLKAALYAGDEDEDRFPLARAQFYLLDKNPVMILKNAALKPESEDGQTYLFEDDDFLKATADAYGAEDVESQLMKVLIRNKLERHQRYAVTTNGAGEAEIKQLEAGNYYLFGIIRRYGEIVVWNLPIEIKFGSNAVEVDQYNAEVVVSGTE